jgi:long-chain acyl-CoA synthetase
MNVAENIARSARLFPERPAIVFGERAFSYSEIDALSNGVAAALKQRGVKRGDRVALYLPNLPAFATGYLGIVKTGAIAVSISARLKAAEAEFILSDSGAVALLTTRELHHEIHLPIGTLLCDGELSSFTGVPDGFAAPCLVQMERDDPAAILYTSGTTGTPKGAVLSHGNVVSNMLAFNHLCGMRPEDRLLLFLPLSHCFGQNAILNSALNCAACVVMDPFEPREIARRIVANRISMLFGVPMSFALLADCVSVEQMATVRYCFSAAATLPLETANRWREKFGMPIYEGYGLTETSPFASYNHRLRFRPGSIGMPIDNVEMRIADPATGRELPAGEQGEIVIRGPNVMLGYWKREAETAAVLRNGWFHSGDIGSIDEDGYFYIVDRIKDMISVGGLKVFPAEVERRLGRHPAVRETAVYGLPDAITGERICADILLVEDAAQEPDAAGLTAFCAAELARYKVPAEFRIVKDLPRNPTGKVLKRVLRERGKAAEYRLDIGRRGTLEGLRLVASDQSPQPNGNEVKVRVHAAGLNFRDVLNVLGQYPGDAGPLGSEFAGEVVETGAAVDRFHPGDKVLGFCFGAMASTIIVSQSLLARIPESISFPEAAILPAAFVTVDLALGEMARLRRGDRILIHAAAGGVGQAAIAYAKSAGAEIYATASRAKWDYLRGQGIAHIFDSRTADFSCTVDVVLNSLTGIVRDRSLEVLTPGGRFIEIGKRGIWQPSEVAARRPDVAYHVLALDSLILSDPEKVGEVLRRVVARFAAREWSVPRYRQFPIEEAAAAFRLMERAAHIGKIALICSGSVSVSEKPAPSAELLERLAASEPRQRKRLVIQHLQTQLRTALGLERNPDPHTGFFDLGLDSLLAVELGARLQIEIGDSIQLPSTLLFDCPTTDALANYLLRALGYIQEETERDGDAQAEEEVRALSDAEIESLIGASLERAGGAAGGE